jgi:3-(3-hydroxy-phenyl)propionate hydroxylase
MRMLANPQQTRGDVALTEHSIVIAGGGSTGLMLAGELALAGVDVAIVERRADQSLAGSRAGGLHARTLEVLDQRGIAGRFLAEGNVVQVNSFNMVPLDISDFPSRHPYSLGLWQNHIERLLAEWVASLRVPVYRDREVAGFTQDAEGVDVRLGNGERVRARYLVGCDGGRSVVRKEAGIAFEGWEPTTSWLIAEVEMAEEPAWGMRTDAAGVHGLSRMGEGQPIRVVLTEARLNTGAEVSLTDLSAALIGIYGTDYGVHSPTWISRFTDLTRQAAAYRSGRVLLAGDAAHVHPPVGGQGLNIGVQDAVNLGWKLARVVKGSAPDSLLDSYQAERHPVAARVLRATMAQMALRRADDRTRALADTIADLVRMEEPRKVMGGEFSGLGLRYNLGEGHPLLGRRMPDLDLDLAAADRPVRLFSLLHGGCPVLLNLGQPGALDIKPWAGRVWQVDAGYGGAWALPVIGEVTAPTAALIRPDGYVAWVGEGTDDGLVDALTAWFGPPSSA